MHFRLRYLHHDLELGDGDFVIGRNVSCQLSLDDALVSRRHAILRVGNDEVSIEDLGSRNGVLVNAKKISGRVRVAAGDKILVGNQELTLLQVSDNEANPSPGAPATKRFATLSSIEASSRGAADEEYDIATMTARPVADPMDDTSFVKRMDGFRVLGSIAEKALAMGRADEAERVLAASLADVHDASQLGRTIPPRSPSRRRALRRSSQRQPRRGAGSTTWSTSTRRCSARRPRSWSMSSTRRFARSQAST